MVLNVVDIVFLSSFGFYICIFYMGLIVFEKVIFDFYKILVFFGSKVKIIVMDIFYFFIEIYKIFSVMEENIFDFLG